ncbi:DUF3742 family protein [Pseudomonas sp. MOB-449]|nr:DUF3742 family protein [Pseudomonas sp. MOB-449]
MKPSAQITFAERTGLTLGRMWRGFVRQEQKVNGWLVERGVPASGATALRWGVKLVMLGVLLYSAFWIALLLVFTVAATWAVQRGALDEKFEWPFMDLEEIRKAPGYDPVPYNDTAHPDYPDEKDV